MIVLPEDFDKICGTVKRASQYVRLAWGNLDKGRDRREVMKVLTLVDEYLMPLREELDRIREDNVPR